MGFQWNEMHLMVRDMMKKFCAEELIPNLDALDTEQMLPYPIMRKMFDSFGMAMSAISRLASSRRSHAQTASMGFKSPLFGGGSQFYGGGSHFGSMFGNYAAAGPKLRRRILGVFRCETRGVDMQTQATPRHFGNYAAEIVSRPMISIISWSHFGG